MVKFSPSLAAVVMRAQSLSPAALAQHYAQVNLESNVAGATDSQLIHGWGPRTKLRQCVVGLTARGALSMSFTRRVFIQRMAEIGGYSAAFSTMRALELIAGPWHFYATEGRRRLRQGKENRHPGAGIAGLVETLIGPAEWAYF